MTAADTYAKARRYNRMMKGVVPETQADKEARGLVFRSAMEIHFTKFVTHFVGFRGDEYARAVRIFGKPDFIHRHNDSRVAGDVFPGDTVVYACDPTKVVPFTFDDSKYVNGRDDGREVGEDDEKPFKRSA